MNKEIKVPMGAAVLIGVSYAIMMTLTVCALVWDAVHPDPLHAQFPIGFRLFLSIPAVTLTIFAIIQMAIAFLHRARGGN